MQARGLFKRDPNFLDRDTERRCEQFGVRRTISGDQLVNTALDFGVVHPRTLQEVRPARKSSGDR